MDIQVLNMPLNTMDYGLQVVSEDNKRSEPIQTSTIHTLRRDTTQTIHFYGDILNLTVREYLEK